MSENLPPQRRPGSYGASRGPGRSGPGATGAAARGLTPAQGAEEAERRLGRPCFHAGQQVEGLFGCVACQFQIRNRGVLPSCPDCGELVWAYLEDGPRPVPKGQTGAPATAPAAPAAPVVQEGVKLEAGPSAPVQVQENVKLEP